MAEPTADTVLATGASLPAEPRPITLDIPGYRVTAVLGEGGMGTVYAGEQQSPRRPVAIKVLHARSPNALARFRAEAEIMARLDHPGIARVLESGDADGCPFLVMELVEGATLDAYAGGLPRMRRLALFVRLCEAVHHAHVKGVIHRDLKPSNVMVRSGDRVVVLDFGVARLDSQGVTSETRAGELIGTPLYMSPEQARLRPDEVDARSDVYTLGVMLYELLSGELPYDVRGLPLTAVSGVIDHDAPISLGKRDPALAGDLEAIVAKALRKEPTERYQSAAALGDDLGRVLDGLPVSVRLPGTLEQLRLFMRRRPLLATGIFGGVFATAVFAVIVTYFWLAAREARETAEAAQRRAEVARAELQVRTDELTLRQARAALGRDPTAAIAWLATLVGERTPASDELVRAAWGVADEALGRGVAQLAVRAHQDEVHWIEPLDPPAPPPGSASGPAAAGDGTGGPSGGTSGAGQPRAGGPSGSASGAGQAPAGGLSGNASGPGQSPAGGPGQPPAGGPSGSASGPGQAPAGGPSGSASGPARAPYGDGTAAASGRAASDDGTATAPRGTSFATGGYDGRVIVWDAPAFVPRTIFQGKGRIHMVRLSPDGTRLAIGGDDGALTVTARDGRVLAQLPGHVGDVQHLAWSPDGKQLATGDDHGNVWLWPGGVAPGRRLAASGVSVGTLAFAPDSAMLAGGDHHGALWCWAVAGGPAITTELGVDVGDVWTDGTRVTAVDATGRVRTWQIGRTLTLVRDVATGVATKRSVFEDHGAWVVLGGISGASVRVEGDRVLPLATHRAQVRTIAIDGTRIATASDDGLIVVNDLASGARVVLRGHAARIRHLAFAGGALVSSDGEGVVRRWELAAMPATVLAGGGAPIDRVAASPDGARLASVDATGEVVRWGLASRARAVVGQASGHASAIAMAGDTVITGSTEGVVTWWSSPPVAHALGGIVQSIAVSGDRVAVGTAAGTVAVFTASGAPVQTLAGNVGGTEVVAFDARGRWLAAGGQDRVLRLYDAAHDFEPRAAWIGPTGDTHFVAFSSASDRVFVAGNDGLVFGWPLTGALESAARAVVGKHVGAVSGLAVSGDGRWLASAGRDDVVTRVPLAGGPAQTFSTGGAASAMAFDAEGGVLAVTRTGSVVHAAPGQLATVIDHGGRRGVAVGADRLAVALDDGTIVLVSSGGRTLPQLAEVLAKATRFRLR